MAMRLPEQRLWDVMRKELKVKRKIHLERIENLVGDGIPDVLCSTVHGGTCLIELKAKDVLPSRETSKVLGEHGVRVSQKNWHLDWKRNGGTSWFLVSIERAEFLLISGRLHDQINDMTIKEMREAAAANGWFQIAFVLQGQ